MFSDRVQVTPSSSLTSAKQSHTEVTPPDPPASVEAPATQRPDASTSGGFRTGPRPPRSPGTSSPADDQVCPSPGGVIRQICHREIGRPRLKNNVSFPRGDLARTGFQCASTTSVSCAGGDQDQPSVPTPAAPSAAPGWQATPRTR